jgi:predicted glycosyltransferase
MRVWADITDSPHVLFFAPIVRRLEEQGHVVTLTARRFASAELIMRRYGLAAMVTSRHRGGGLGARAVGLLNRTAQLIGSASSGRFDVAVGSHATDFVLANWTLGVPQLTLLDDERLRRSNALNLRLVDRVAVSETVPLSSLRGLGASPDKLLRYPGFTEEYYLGDLELDDGVLVELGLDPRRVIVVVRPPRPPRRSPAGATAAARPSFSGARDVVVGAPRQRALPPHGHPPEQPSSAVCEPLDEVVRDLARRRNVTVVLIPRDGEQRRRFGVLAGEGLVVAGGPVDGVSLLAAADAVIGFGGVMEREAAALGTPAYSITTRPPSAIDLALRDEGRVRTVAAAGEIVVHKKDARLSTVRRRDPQLFVDELVALAGHGALRRRGGPPPEGQSSASRPRRR